MTSDRDRFYEQRDGRTNRVSPNSTYQDVHLGLTVDSEWATTYPGQIAILTAANILARWCRRVSLDLPDLVLSPYLHRGEGGLAEHVLATMRAADPYGDFQATSVGKELRGLHLGPYDPPGRPGWVFAHGAGWGSTISSSPLSARSSDLRNPIGAIGAACLGVAAIFMDAVRQPRSWSDPLEIDFFSLKAKGGSPQAFPATLDVSRTLVVGAGAVGSSLLHFLSLMPTEGEFFVVDHDRVKVLNLNRSLLQTAADVGRNKAEVAADYLQRYGFAAQAHPESYANFMSNRSNRDLPFDLVVPVANEENVRWNLATNYPPIMIYGTTDSNWGAYLGRHIPLVEECLACRFPVESPASAMACATAPLPAQQPEAPDAALPFLSPLAALFAVAEISKLQLPKYPFQGSRAGIDLAGFPENLAAFRTEPTHQCGACKSRKYRIFHALRGQTRWAFLSQTEE